MAVETTILRRHMMLLRLTPVAALGGPAAASAALGVTLLVVNVVGLFALLRSAEVDRPSPDTLRISYGPGDNLMWPAAHNHLARAPGEYEAAFAHRMTTVVAQSVMHSWH